jgi:predicted phosphodiesterase
VIDEIRTRGIPTIAGNYDQGIGLRSDDCGCAYKEEYEKDMGKISISYTNSIVRPEERNYLRTLPAHIKVEFQLNKDTLNLLLVHGSPRKINDYLFEDRDEKSLLRIMERADADIMCFGHTHKPFHRILPTEPAENRHFRHAINIGSVGKPKDNSPKGCYVILTIKADSDITNKDAVQVEFIRFEYDVEKAAKAIEKSALPNDYADMLRKGY